MARGHGCEFGFGMTRPLCPIAILRVSVHHPECGTVTFGLPCYVGGSQLGLPACNTFLSVTKTDFWPSLPPWVWHTRVLAMPTLGVAPSEGHPESPCSWWHLPPASPDLHTLQTPHLLREPRPSLPHPTCTQGSRATTPICSHSFCKNNTPVHLCPLVSPLLLWDLRLCN